MGRFSTDTAGMSESIGVAVLIGMTILVTAMVGLNVLVAEEDDTDGPQANFTYDYVGDSELLIVTHQRGDELPAGKIEFHGPDAKASWAELANREPSARVGPGDITQLSSGNPYGQRVSARDTITVYYNASGNLTTLSRWNGANT